jgi:ferritin-like metal-binding protein YciE
MNTMHDLFASHLQDVHSAETQLVEALPKMAETASSSELKAALDQHLQETQEQARRVEQIMSRMQLSPGGEPCMAMPGLIEEGEHVVEKAGNAEVRDAGIIAAGQAVEHYEIARYGTLVAWADQLGLDDEVIDLLEQSLDEEKQTDPRLNDLALMSVNEQAQA